MDFQFDFTYEGEKISALKQVEGSVRPGKCVVLCGSSGCGKSTLLRCINHLIPQFFEGRLTGFCCINGKDMGEMSIGETGEMVSSVFQDPRSQFFTINSSTEVAFGLENHGMSESEIRKRVEEAFSTFHLEKLKNRNVYELSSGERQMISILSAWAMDTDILLLDEPTANLDFTAISMLKNVLQLMKKKGKTMIFSEHRLHYLTDIADEYWLMESGELKYRFSSDEFLQMTEKEYAGLPLRIRDLSKLKLDNNYMEQGLIGESGGRFCIKNLSYRYNKANGCLLKNLSFSASIGEIIGVVGRNGCGKTTFGKTICGLLKSVSGEISFNGKKMSRKELLDNTLFVMQESEFQFFTNSVQKELLYGLEDTNELRGKIECVLKKMDMWETRDRHPFTLSGGQMQKLSLMMAYVSEKRVIVLDEPTAGLDAVSLRNCTELIRMMRQEKLVIVITHDAELLAKVCTRCCCMDSGAFTEEYNMFDEEALKHVIAFMEDEKEKTPDGQISHRSGRTKECRLHPCSKLLFWIVTLVVTSMTDSTTLWMLCIALIFVMMLDGWYAKGTTGAITLAGLWGLGNILDHTAVNFALILFPRMIAIGLATFMLIGENESSRTIAALRKMHIHERIIMICAVVFRFFPVLSEDMKLMRQSIHTRSTLVLAGERRHKLLEYVEIMTVPMALRVIRIAETLSASAETRGIDLNKKRSSYIQLKFGMADVICFCTLTALIAGKYML